LQDCFLLDDNPLNFNLCFVSPTFSLGIWTLYIGLILRHLYTITHVFGLYELFLGLAKKMYINGMKRALSKWVLIELSVGLILLLLFILNVI
jgi:hypothetical protein